MLFACRRAGTRICIGFACFDMPVRSTISRFPPAQRAVASTQVPLAGEGISPDPMVAASALAVAVRHTGQGVMAVGVGARLVYANEVAYSCLGPEGPLRLRQGCLTPTGVAGRCVSEALLRLEQTGRPQFFALHRPATAGSSAQTFAVTAILEEQTMLRQRVLILDPFGERGALDESALSNWLGLTPAQARVAACLSRGLSPEEVATHCGRSIATIRTQIRAILERTNLENLQQLHRALAGLGRGFCEISR